MDSTVYKSGNIHSSETLLDLHGMIAPKNLRANVATVDYRGQKIMVVHNESSNVLHTESNQEETFAPLENANGIISKVKKRDMISKIGKSFNNVNFRSTAKTIVNQMKVQKDGVQAYDQTLN